jgi:hypothetical protein
MLKSGRIIRGKAYVKVNGEWYLLATIAKQKELNAVV